MHRWSRLIDSFAAPAWPVHRGTPPRALSLPSLIALILILASATTLRAAPSLRGALSWGWDDNVREAMDPREKGSDRFLRILVDASPGRAGFRGFQTASRLRGMVERYDRYATESRLQGELTGEVVRAIGAGGSLWASAWIEGRAYPDSLPREYRRSSTSIGAAAPFHRGRVGLGLSDRTIDYRRNPGLDRRGDAFAVDYRRGFSNGLDAHLWVEFEWSRWNRSAIKQIAPDIFETAGRQKDRSREMRFTLRYLKGALFETTFGWESVRSNSFGYSVSRRRIEGAVTGILPGSVTAQIAGRLEGASYHDRDLDRVFVIRSGEDVEAGEDSNSLTLRIRRQLIPRVLLEGRASVFRNESLLVGSRYDKRVASIGLVWAPLGQSDF